MVRGLALSGGGARGSFQIGALDCLYTVFGYRPEVISSTSVGSINAIALAQARTDEEAIAQLRKLRDVWNALTGPGDFYTVQEWFRRVTGSASLNLSEGLPGVRLGDVLYELIFHNLAGKAGEATSLAVLDPLEAKLRDPTMVDPAKLATGLPLRMTCASLETGRLRYVTGDGRFLEDDNRTPVASALPFGVPLQERNSDFITAVTNIRTLMEAIEREKETGAHDTRWGNVARLTLELRRAQWRAETAYDRLAEANAALPIPVQARVDPVIGALASSAMPGIFAPYRIGQETYVDGGIREIVPVRAATQLGATEVLAIACSALNLPRAGYAGAQNFITSLLGSLTDVALKEIVKDDLAPRDAPGVQVTVIIPSFDVHDTAVVDMGLIHISMDYGYMRAADVMTKLPAQTLKDAFALTDAIARIRTDTHLLSYAWTHPYDSARLQVLRFRKWLIGKLVEARIASGVPLPAYATLWFQRWEQGSSTINKLASPWDEFWTPAEGIPAINPYSYVPDGWTYEEVGDLDGVYLVRAGARFRSTAEDVAAVTGTPARPALTLPKGSSRHLPAVPVAGTVLTEVTTATHPAEPGSWYIDGTRRYLLNTAALAALGNPTPLSIPAGGLAQIPDGGTPYFIGGLVVTDTAGTLLHVWPPTPQVAGTTTTTGVTLRNRSGRGPVTVTAIEFTTTADTATSRVFRALTQLPKVVQDGSMLDVDVRFNAPAPGPITGIIEVRSDDAIAPIIRIPLSTTVLPIGAHGELDLEPDTLTLPPARVGASTYGQVILTNAGGRDAELVEVGIDDGQPPGQLTVGNYGVQQVLQPGQSTTLSVTHTPTQPGPASAVLRVDMRSSTDHPSVTYRRRYLARVKASARTPSIFLARTPRQLFRGGPDPASIPTDDLVLAGPLAPQPVGRATRMAELTVLDFGLAPVGESAARSFWIWNVGDLPLKVGGPQPYDLSRLAVTNVAGFPVTVVPGQDAEVQLSYSSGYRTGRRSESELHVYSDDPLRPVVVLRVTIQAEGPYLLDPSEFNDLGVVPSGTGLTLKFVSGGTQPVSVSEIRLRDGRDFMVSGPHQLPLSLAPGDELLVAVTVTAAATGVYQDSLILHHDGVPNRETSIVIRATIA